ncbi:MAG: CRISPR-associated CARF protein Csa3 [Thermoprotei archaeon]
MATLVFTLGFDVSAVVAKISEVGLGGDEEIVVVTVKSDSGRARLGVTTVKSHVEVLNSRGMRLKFRVVELEPERGDPLLDLEKLYDVLKGSSDVSFELSGGMRYCVLLCYMVALLLGDSVRDVSTRLESSGVAVGLPILRAVSPTSVEIKVLVELSRGGATQRDLAERLGRKMSSVSRVLAGLVEKSLVAVNSGKPKSYAVTPLGKIYLKQLGYL